jgi:hypothetical protein
MRLETKVLIEEGGVARELSSVCEIPGAKTSG